MMQDDELDQYRIKGTPSKVYKLPAFPTYEEKKKKLIEKYGQDFDQTIQTFSLNVAEQLVMNEWLEELKAEILESQGLPPTDEPYYGAIGGGVAISFTQTGLGTIKVAKESTTGKELNITDALDWFFFG